MGNSRKGFTLIEIVVGILVMLLLLTVARLSITIEGQSAKREAERVEAYIYRLMQMADRRRQNFDLDTFQDYIEIKWEGIVSIDTSFKASPGCSYSDNFVDITYNVMNRRFKKGDKDEGGTITINGADNDKWFVILSLNTEGRVRISDTSPK